MVSYARTVGVARGTLVGW